VFVAFNESLKEQDKETVWQEIYEGGKYVGPLMGKNAHIL
jgi:hypothetical protein